MARWAAARSVPFVNFSSDYVFDGTKRTPYVESDEPNPINTYGNSKLAGEIEGLRGLPRDAGGSQLLARLRDQSELRGHRVAAGPGGRHPRGRRSDRRPQHRRRSRGRHVGGTRRGVTGILHLSSAGEASWFQLARRALELADMDPELVQPISTEEYGAGVMRPAYGVLASERETGIELPSWQQSLPAAIKEMLTWV